MVKSSSSFREAASNFLTALSLQRKSRSRQLSHQVMSGNIWAALRIALSMMDQPELFQAANIGDLDLLMKAFNLDMWVEIGLGDKSLLSYQQALETSLFSPTNRPWRRVSTLLPNAKNPKCTVGKSCFVQIMTSVWSILASTTKSLLLLSTSAVFLSTVCARRVYFAMDLHCNLWFPRRAQGRAKTVQVMP